MVRRGKVIYFDEVQPPRRELFKNGIIVFLRAGLGHVHAVHVAVPGAEAFCVCDVGGGVVRAFDG